MKYNREKHCRRSIRMSGYDYRREGMYFITVCTWDRQSFFGEIVDGAMQLNPYGEIACRYWRAIPEHFPHVALDVYVIMPNHVHCIIAVGARHAVPLPSSLERFGNPVAGSIPTIIRSFKSSVTKHINELRQTPGLPLWQRNYYEHVVRDEDSLLRIRQYILHNPSRWLFDHENPAATTTDPLDAWRS